MFGIKNAVAQQASLKTFPPMFKSPFKTISKFKSLFKTGSKHGRSRPLLAAFLISAIGLGLAACGAETERVYPGKKSGDRYDPHPTEERSKLFGNSGIPLLGGSASESSGSSGIGVSSFLWRAALDTVAFMPLASADPFGGVIITDWHNEASNQNERFKITVYILDKTLRADAVKVAVFRQKRTPGANSGPVSDWIDSPVNPETGFQIENAILTKARELKIQALGEQPE